MKSSDTTIGEVFPSLPAFFGDGPLNTISRAKMNWSPPFIDELIQDLRVAFNNLASRSDGTVETWARALYDDIIVAKQRYPKARAALDVIQLDVTTSLMLNFLHQKQLNSLRRWI